jgi:hypothetical protein
MKARLLELRFDHVADQGKYLWLGLQFLRLRARMLDQLDDKSLDFVILEILIDDSLCALRFHIHLA